MSEGIRGMKAFSVAFFIVCLMEVSGLIVTANANPVPITSYDVEGIPEPGCGGWSHTYSTAGQNTGRRVCCQPFGAGCATPPVAVLNYFGGTGTLNDGTISTSVTDTMLFHNRADTIGQLIQPVITLHLSRSYLIKSIRLFGGDFSNLFPGALNGVTVEFGGTSVTLATTPSGPSFGLFPTDDVLDLSNTPLATIPTDQIVLRNVTVSSFFGFPLDQFSITEVTVDGTPEADATLGDLGAAHLWIGLKNSDDVGLRLDLQAEVFLDGRKVGEGQTNNVSSGSSGFNNAILQTIPLTLIGGTVTLPSNAELQITVSSRRTCVGGGHSTGTARLWFNGSFVDANLGRDAGSRFDATIDSIDGNYFLLSSFALGTTAGSSRVFIDKLVDSKLPCPNRTFIPFGAWSITLP